MCIFLYIFPFSFTKTKITQNKQRKTTKISQMFTLFLFRTLFYLLVARFFVVFIELEMFVYISLPFKLSLNHNCTRNKSHFRIFKGIFPAGVFSCCRRASFNCVCVSHTFGFNDGNRKSLWTCSNANFPDAKIDARNETFSSDFLCPCTHSVCVCVC